MAASMANIFRSCRYQILQFERRIVNILSSSSGNDPAFAYDVINVEEKKSLSNTQNSSVLESILGNGIFYAVQKHRRTVERRLKRRMGYHRHFEHADKKKGIIECLECGHWHQRHTICGNCYKKVRQETELTREAMGDNALKYYYPTSEVVFTYRNEKNSDDQIQSENKYVVDVEKDRPSWFAKNLMTKRTVR